MAEDRPNRNPEPEDISDEESPEVVAHSDEEGEELPWCGVQVQK